VKRKQKKMLENVRCQIPGKYAEMYPTWMADVKDVSVSDSCMAVCPSGMKNPATEADNVFCVGAEKELVGSECLAMRGEFFVIFSPASASL
jgi:hypothetical protein